MFDAKDIDFNTIEPVECESFKQSTGAGRGFAVSGGVAGAVTEALGKIAPDREVLTDYADGLRECRKLLTLAKVGKRNGYLLEGMACPGGCVAGAGTINAPHKSAAKITRYQLEAAEQNSLNTPFAHMLHEVEE